MVFCLLIVLSSFIYVGYVYSQQPNQDIYEFETSKKIIGCEYLINGVWVRQFTGRINEISGNSFEIEWTRYDEDTPIKNTIHRNINATKYDVRLKVFYDVNTSRTYGVFQIYWLKGNYVIDVENDDGYLMVRDDDGLRVYLEDIEKIRIGQYDVGDFK